MCAAVTSNRMKKLQEISEDFIFQIPKEGSILSIENVAIPAKTKKTDMVYKFIDFLISKKIAMFHADLYGTNPSNACAIDEKISENSIFFPKDEMFGKLHLITNEVPLDKVDSIWLGVRFCKQFSVKINNLVKVGVNMEKLNIKVQSILEKYKQKRSNFKTVIDKWGQKGYKSDYASAMELFKKAESYAATLMQEIADPGADKNILNSKIKDFKTIYKKLNEITKPVWQQWLEAVVIAVGLAIVLRNFVFGLYHVPTGSAEPNILVGDRIWGNKMAYYFADPKRGDLVIFDNPEVRYDKSNIIKYWWQRYIGLAVPLLGLSGGPDNWVKRLIAGPGDVD